MKLPLRHIIPLIIAVLLGIFGYQVYWLLHLYHTQTAEAEQHIRNAIELSDYNEMSDRMSQISQESGSKGTLMSVSMGFVKGYGNYIRTTKDQQINDTLKSTMELKRVDLDSSGQQSQAVRDESTLHENTPLAYQMMNNQRALHSLIDSLKTPDIKVFDRYFSSQLRKHGLNLPHKVELVENNRIVASCSTLGSDSTASLVTFKKTLNLEQTSFYRISIMPLAKTVLRQMAGILSASALILVMLAVTFWYLLRTLARLKTLDEMKSDFTNNMTHELKTPIAVAYAANDALLHFDIQNDKKRAVEYLTIEKQQLERLGGLVEQILSMSMDQRKALHLSMEEEVEVRPLLEQLATQMELGADKTISIMLDIEPADVTIRADRSHLQNVLSNLIDNAVKYSQDSVSVTIVCRKNRIEVQDNGIGIPADKQNFVFDRFYRVPNGKLHDVKGCGLGLYYVRSVMEQMGGSVAVESQPGKGTTFKLIFNG